MGIAIVSETDLAMASGRGKVHETGSLKRTKNADPDIPCIERKSKRLEVWGGDSVRRGRGVLAGVSACAEVALHIGHELAGHIFSDRKLYVALSTEKY